jgi:hypothetical protein
VLHIVLFNVCLILFVSSYFYNFLCYFFFVLAFDVYLVGFCIVFVVIFIILFCSPKVSIGVIKDLKI